MKVHVAEFANDLDSGCPLSAYKRCHESAELKLAQEFRYLVYAKEKDFPGNIIALCLLSYPVFAVSFICICKLYLNKILFKPNRFSNSQD